MIVTVKVRDLREGDKITTNNRSYWAYGAEVHHVNVGQLWGDVVDCNGHDISDGSVDLEARVEVERTPTAADIRTRVLELLQPVYAQVLRESGIDHGDISPGELDVLEAAERHLADVVASWISNTLTG